MIYSFFLIMMSQLLAYPCPETLSDHQQAPQALRWLENHGGRYPLGDCVVEITYCDQSKVPSVSSTLGEVLLIDGKGREFYYNIRLPEQSVRKVKTDFKVNRYSLWVKQKNSYYEQQNGRTEAWRFEMQSEWGDSSQIKRIEMGVYTTNSQLNQDSGNDSHWMICKRSP